jgi:hypothetical protein
MANTNLVIHVPSPVVNVCATQTVLKNTLSISTRAKEGIFKLKTYTTATPGSYDPTLEPHTLKEALTKP